MARPSKDSEIDYTVAHDLTYGLLERAACPDGVPFVLLKDADKKGLRLRITKAKGKHWQFETRVKGKLFTRALGEWPTVAIGDARAKAHDLRGQTEKGIDPRDVEFVQKLAAEKAETDRLAAETAAAKAAAFMAEADRQAALTMGEAWAVYLAERKPHWGERHYLDHIAMIRAGGLPANRGTKGRGVTVAGPLHSFTALPLRDLDSATVEAWAVTEAKTRPTVARLAWRCLKAFLTWCSEQPQYAALVTDRNPAKSKKARESLGKPGIKQDALLKEQLPAWFEAVRNINNPAISAYLQVMVMTGTRPSEVLEIEWDDINTKWHGLTIRDKVEGTRIIPLTPYVSHLLHALPRRNQYVFASNPRGGAKKAAPLSHPNVALTTACKVAGIDGLTLHGLRRSFKSLTEWLEIPAGVVAQIMGHKPSATAEKHYTVRPLDLLRVHHEKIEAWILEQAGVTFDAMAEPGKLRVVAG